MSESNSNIHDSVELLACHDCDFLYRLPPLKERELARCDRCGSILAKGDGNSIDNTLAYTLAASIFFIIANVYPILGLRAAGQEQFYTLIYGAMVLTKFDLWAVGFVVFLTTIFFPLLCMIGLLYVLIPLRTDRRPRYFIPIFKFSLALLPWGMVGVYMLGVLVAIVKLADLATVIPGWGLYALVSLLLVTVAATATLNPRIVWEKADSLLKSNPDNVSDNSQKESILDSNNKKSLPESL
ncbi:MAG: paraquat-inducible protein A [Magnetococcales bacterium]|nr:paraquat-inducible protein A [Magnetococcales bacterium]